MKSGMRIILAVFLQEKVCTHQWGNSGSYFKLRVNLSSTSVAFRG